MRATEPRVSETLESRINAAENKRFGARRPQ